MNNQNYIADCRCRKCGHKWIELDEKLDRQDRCPKCGKKLVTRKKQK